MISTMVNPSEVIPTTTTTKTTSISNTHIANTRSSSTSSTSSSSSSSSSTINDLQRYFPSLYELIDTCTKLNPSNDILSSFNSYLISRHCSENLQFIIDINNYLQLKDATRFVLLKNWQYIYDKYLTFDADWEINIPASLKSQLSMVDLPNFEVLSQCKKQIYDDLLINLYKEFTKQYHECTYRPCLCKRRTSSLEQIEHQRRIQEQYQTHNLNNNHNYHHHPQEYQSKSSHTVQLHHPQHQRRQSLQHSLSLNITSTTHKSKFPDDNVCPIEKVTPITSPINHKGKEEHNDDNHIQHKHQHQHHHHYHTKQYGGYDYYTIPSTESSSEEEHSDGVTTKNNSRNNSRNNSTSSSSRGSSIGSIMDNSVLYFNKMKKFKFGRRFSNDQ